MFVFFLFPSFSLFFSFFFLLLLLPRGIGIATLSLNWFPDSSENSAARFLGIS